MARMKTSRPCQHCGADYFPHRGNGDSKFCSQKCHHAVLHADAEFQRKAGRAGGVVRGQQMSEAAAGDWYRKKDGVHVHRTVAEAKIGRQLRPGEIVHHIDEDNQNNHPDNLLVCVDQAEHMRVHAAQRAARRAR